MADNRRWTLGDDMIQGTSALIGPSLAVDEEVEVMPVAEHERLLKAMWDRQEARIEEYDKANCSQKHRIRELESDATRTQGDQQCQS